ncbi:MAG: RagB/SusD family nutrient uptake outer membrane protein [Flavobacteriaceae bacterium]
MVIKEDSLQLLNPTTAMSVGILHPISSIPFMATAANYNVGEYTQAWTDQALAKRAVRYETRLETAMEGNRFFDLQRCGGGVQAEVLNDYLARESEFRIYLQGVQFTSPRNEFYSIPSQAIDRSLKDGEPTLTQNPNY